MTPDRWIALLAIGVSLLAICVPVLVTVMLRASDRHRTETQRKDDVIAKQAETIEKQRETIIDYKIAQRELGGVGESVRQLLAAVQVTPRDGSGT